MRLSTRLAIAMVSLVVLTALAIGTVAYRNLEASIVPNEIIRLESRARLQAVALDSHVRAARADILASLGPASVEGFIRSHRAGGIDPVDGTTEETWRRRVEQNYLAQLQAKPDYDQFRLIGIEGHGQELIRVDRAGPNRSIRVVPREQLQPKGNRPYYTESIGLPKGQVYISPLSLNQENGKIEVPYKPSLRVVTPVFDAHGKLFGLVLINIDMRAALDELKNASVINGFAYAVDRHGSYYAHPDPAKLYGEELDQPYFAQNDFPALAPVIGTDKPLSGRFADAAGRDFILTTHTAYLAGGTIPTTIVDALPVDVALAGATGVGTVSLLAGVGAALIAAAIAYFIARSMGGPVTQLARTMERFTGDEALPPLPKTGEIGVLSAAFERMTRTVRERTTALESEVAERKAAQEALEKVTARERIAAAAVEFANDAVLTSDLEGLITTWNPAAEQMFGYTAEQAVGRHIDIIVPPSRRDEQSDNLRKILSGERVGNFETVRMAKDGSTREVSLNLTAIFGKNGDVIGSAAIARDISQRKRHERELLVQAEELRRSNSDLEQFAYVASHDLQEPLRMVASYSELLAERYRGKLDERADKYIHYAVDGAKRMQRLVNDLLTYSRVGRHQANLARISSHTVVADCLKVLKRAIDDSKAEIVVGNLPEITFEAGQLGQIFQNLISNAIKFRGPEPPRVKIDAVRTSRHWMFSVADNGIGIDQQYSDRVFQMFQRLHDRETYEGNGIGLPIARRIVDRHGGRIWFESEPGKGTTFYFTLPADQEDTRDTADSDFARRRQSG